MRLVGSLPLSSALRCATFALAALASLPAGARDWQARAGHDLASPGGKRYEAAVGKIYGPMLAEVSAACVKSSPSTFTIYLELTSRGTVSASSASPASPLADCFVAHMSKRTWPRPPFAPFVYRLDLLGNPEAF